MAVRKEAELTTACLYDQFGFEHPIEELFLVLRTLRAQRQHIAQLPCTYPNRDKFLKGLDAAIQSRVAMLTTNADDDQMGEGWAPF